MNFLYVIIGILLLIIILIKTVIYRINYNRIIQFNKKLKILKNDFIDKISIDSIKNTFFSKQLQFLYIFQDLYLFY